MVYCDLVSFCVRRYHVVQASGAANKVGSQRPHQGGVRWENIKAKLVPAASVIHVCYLLWILTAIFHLSRNTRSHEVCIWQSAALSRHSPDEFVQESVSSLDIWPLCAVTFTLGQERGHRRDGRLGHGIVQCNKHTGHVLTDFTPVWSHNLFKRCNVYSIKVIWSKVSPVHLMLVLLNPPTCCRVRFGH